MIRLPLFGCTNRSQSLRFVSVAAVVLALSGPLTVGCSSGKKAPKIAAVDGVVTFQGAPVAHAKIVFLPKDTKTGQAISIGQTNGEGRFAKIRLASSGAEGAVVGSYSVTITEGWPENAPIPVDDLGQEKTPPRGKWPQKYRDSAAGAIVVDVVANQANHFEFDLSK